MDVEEYVKNALDLYERKDSFAAIMHLCELEDPKTTMEALLKTMRHKYWQEKDLVGTLAFARAGIHFGLMSAMLYDDTDPNLAHELRSGAKGFAYDFASSAWIGWNEEGVVITSADQAAGFDAARVNLRLAVELERGDLPTSRAHWMVGAYHLAEGEYNLAIESFEQGVVFARKADARADELLNQGYILIVQLLASPENSHLIEEYQSLKSSFQNVEHGEDFIQQLDTAYKVLSS